MFFLTCAGSKHYADPRMNSLEAALIFAKSSKLQVGYSCHQGADSQQSHLDLQSSSLQTPTSDASVVVAPSKCIRLEKLPKLPKDKLQVTCTCSTKQCKRYMCSHSTPNCSLYRIWV